MRRVFVAHGLMTLLLLVTTTGCSSLGFSLWPAQFPLLRQTKEFAARSPVPSGMAHELAKRPIDAYYIEPGDRLLIEPIRFDSEFRMSGDQLVQVDGSIDLGQYGRLRVAGMTVEDVELSVEERMVQMGAEREQINVQLMEANAAQVYVLGEVGSPGSFALAGNETVLDAIVMAGGLTSRASPCDIILVRPTLPGQCRVVQRVCYRQITQLGDVSTNYHVQPGDRVVVGSRTLREELAFWKQTTACECCSQSRCVECNPARVNYNNRFIQLLNPFPLPRRSPATEEDAAEVIGSESTSPVVPRMQPGTMPRNDRPDPMPRSPAGINRDVSPSDDTDIYLPPVTPGPSQTGSTRNLFRQPDLSR
jgi:polysaccharide biosynthesis/export protein